MKPRFLFDLTKILCFQAFLVFILLNTGCKSPEKKIQEIAKCESVADEKSIKIILKYMKDKNEKVREQAAYAAGARSGCMCPSCAETTLIGRLNDQRILEALMILLQDASPKVRTAAVYSLIVYKNPIMVDPLIAALQDTDGLENISIGAYAAYILGNLNNKQAINPLIKALRNDTASIRAYAQNALYKMRENKLVEEEIKKLTPLFLAELNSNSNDTIIRGIETAESFRIYEAVPQLNELVKNAESEIRASAASALGHVGNETSASGLLKALHDPVPRVQDNAVWALSVLHEKASIPGLVKLLYENDLALNKKVLSILCNKFYSSDFTFREKQERYQEIIPQIIKIVGMLDREDKSRYDALGVLLQLDDSRALPVFFEELKNYRDDIINKDWGIIQKRIWIAKTIGKTGNDTQKQVAIEWLKRLNEKSSDSDARKQAEFALKEIDRKR